MARCPALSVVSAGACGRRGRDTVLCIDFRIVYESVEIDGPRRLKIRAIDVYIALRPWCGCIVNAGGFEFEERVRYAFVIGVGRGQLIVDAVHVIDIAVIAHVPLMGPAIGVQHAEVVVEGVVLLQHEDDVSDRLRATRRAYGHGDSGRVAARGSGGFRRVGGCRGRSDRLRPPVAAAGWKQDRSCTCSLT
jgi:hypothetical protein